MQGFINPFISRSQEHSGPASWLAAQLGGTGTPNVSGWYSCKCPAHNDARASLSLKDTPHGLVAKCFAGCRPAEIKAALHDLKTSGALANPRPSRDRKVETSKIDLLQSAANIWHASVLNTDPLLQVYMHEHRWIVIALPPTLRCNHSLYHAETNSRSPGMVAVVQDVHGTMCAIHRTWIDPATGGKAKLTPTRKSLCQTTGHSVHLGEPDDVLAVSEGIESGLAFQQLRDIPVWAALSAPGIASLIVPDRVKEVIVACDNDRAGIAAANSLTHRLLRQNPKASVTQQFPSVGKDFNDMLLLGVRA